MCNSHSFSHRSPFGRRFQKGVFKHVILDLLKDKPSYGYEIIRKLEERCHGFYVPSPGIVYPTLQVLEEMGYVTSSQQNGKKVYTITDEGRKYLSEKAEFTEEINCRIQDWCTGHCGNFHETIHEFARLGQLLRQPGQKLDNEKLPRIRDIVSKAISDIEKIIKD